MALFGEVVSKKINVDGHTVSVPQQTTPENIIRIVGKDPNTTNIVTQGEHGTVQYLPKTQPIRVRDGQVLETSMPGVGGS
jgi:hypothetical protein